MQGDEQGHTHAIAWDSCIVMATDPGLVATYAKATDPFIRRLAAGVSTDQTLLAEMAKRDSDTDVRLQAIRRLTDRAVLEDLSRTAARPDEKAVAKARLREIEGQR